MDLKKRYMNVTPDIFSVVLVKKNILLEHHFMNGAPERGGGERFYMQLKIVDLNVIVLYI